MGTRELIKRFLLPEAELTLKVVFDNIRNYLICAAFIALALWFKRGAPNVPAFARGSAFQNALGFMSVLSSIAAAGLFLFNLAQSYHIFLQVFEAALPLFHRGIDRLEAQGRHGSRLIAIIGLLALFLACLAYAVLTVALAGGMFLVIVYLILFSAFGRAP